MGRFKRRSWEPPQLLHPLHLWVLLPGKGMGDLQRWGSPLSQGIFSRDQGVKPGCSFFWGGGIGSPPCHVRLVGSSIAPAAALCWGFERGLSTGGTDFSLRETDFSLGVSAAAGHPATPLVEAARGALGLGSREGRELNREGFSSWKSLRTS